MVKTTTYQELEALRKEAEALHKQKMLRKKQEEAKAKEEAKAQEQEIAEIQEKVEKILDSVKEGTVGTKEALHQLLEDIRREYENISPASAIVLFALGAVFGYVFSSKPKDY